MLVRFYDENAYKLNGTIIEIQAELEELIQRNLNKSLDDFHCILQEIQKPLNETVHIYKKGSIIFLRKRCDMLYREVIRSMNIIDPRIKAPEDTSMHLQQILIETDWTAKDIANAIKNVLNGK